MSLATQITFRGIVPSDTITTYIHKRADRIARLSDRVTHCHVVVETVSRHHRKGPRFRVRVDLRVPRAELVVSDQHARNEGDVYACIDEAFDDAVRRLRTHLSSHREGYHGGEIATLERVRQSALPTSPGRPKTRVVQAAPSETATATKNSSAAV
ncbi:MAG: HPF/RaiA family ribosome-associated protein [Polyangiales bacterium]